MLIFFPPSKGENFTGESIMITKTGINFCTFLTIGLSTVGNSDNTSLTGIISFYLKLLGPMELVFVVSINFLPL